MKNFTSWRKLLIKGFLDGVGTGRWPQFFKLLVIIRTQVNFLWT
jgi:hypothetical protein